MQTWIAAEDSKRILIDPDLQTWIAAERQDLAAKEATQISWKKLATQQDPIRNQPPDDDSDEKPDLASVSPEIRRHIETIINQGNEGYIELIPRAGSRWY